MNSEYSNPGYAQSIAFAAIGWIVAEPRRAERFLSLTGLDPAQLRAGIGETGVQSAAIDFLLGHEADLVACAGDIGMPPSAIAAARGALGA